MKGPRKHHYVTASYLAAWTASGLKDSQLQIVDKVAKKHWSAKPDTIAKETDLYIVDLSSVEEENDALAIEKALGKIEDAAIPAIKQFSGGAVMPSRSNVQDVLCLAATLMMRSPRTLDNLTRIAAGGYIKGWSPSSGPDALPASLAELIELIMAGHSNQPDRPEGQCRNEALALAFSQVQNYFAVFNRLCWRKAEAANDAGEFVCSDHPVVIQGFQVMPNGDCQKDGNDPAGVCFPIGPTTILTCHSTAGKFQSTLDRDTVADLNWHIIDQAERCVFFRREFYTHGVDGIRDWKEEVQRLTAK